MNICLYVVMASCAFKAFSIPMLIFSIFFSCLSFSILCKLMWRKPEMKSGSNLLLANLMFVDLMFSNMCTPFVIATIAHDKWNYGTTWCLGFTAIFFIFATCHVSTVLLISIRRYFSRILTRSSFLLLQSGLEFSYCRVKSCVLPAIWTVSLCLSIPFIVGYFTSEYRDGQIKCTPSYSLPFKIYITAIGMTLFIFPFTLSLVWEVMNNYQTSFCKEKFMNNLIWCHHDEGSNCTSRLKDDCFTRNSTGHYTNILEEARKHSSTYHELVQPKQQEKKISSIGRLFSSVTNKLSGVRCLWHHRSISTVFSLFVVTILTLCPYLVVLITQRDVDGLPSMEASSPTVQDIHSTVTSDTYNMCGNCTENSAVFEDAQQVPLWVALISFLPYLGPLLRFIVYTSRISKFRAVLVYSLRFIGSTVTSFGICFDSESGSGTRFKFYRAQLHRRVHPDMFYISQTEDDPRTRVTEYKLAQKRPAHRLASKPVGLRTPKNHGTIHSISEKIADGEGESNTVLSSEELSPTSHSFNFITSWNPLRHQMSNVFDVEREVGTAQLESGYLDRAPEHVSRTMTS